MTIRVRGLCQIRTISENAARLAIGVGNEQVLPDGDDDPTAHVPYYALQAMLVSLDLVL